MNPSLCRIYLCAVSRQDRAECKVVGMQMGKCGPTEQQLTFMRHPSGGHDLI